VSSRAYVFLATLLLGACKDEFPNAPPLTLAIDTTAGWHDTVAVTDVDTLHIKVTLPGGGSVTGVQVHWVSSNPAKLEVKPLALQAGQENDSLILQLSTVINAHARDSAVIITATVNRPGFAREAFSRKITVMERWISIGAGWNHTCAVAISGAVYCWGSGLLGDGTTIGSATPSRVAGGFEFDSVSAGSHTCGTLRGTGLAYCWGNNRYGEVGNNTQFDQLTPDQVSLGQTFQSMSAGAQYSCGVASTGIAYCWGFNRLDQLGDFAPPAQRPFPDPILANCDGMNSKCALTPVPVRSTSDPLQAIGFRSVDAGPGVFTCGVKTDQSATCWGLVPLITQGSFLMPPNCILGAACFWIVPGGHTFTTVSTGFEHACGVAIDKHVYCWGVNLFGELGRNGPGDTLPRQVGGGFYAQVTSGSRFSCAVAVDSTAVCWGSNSLGQLGNPASTGSPVQVDGSHQFRSVSAGLEHACGITVGGAALCWGTNETGQLGLGPLSAPDACGATPCSRKPQRVHEPPDPGGD